MRIFFAGLPVAAGFRLRPAVQRKKDHLWMDTQQVNQPKIM